jgi:hypothetical protein
MNRKALILAILNVRVNRYVGDTDCGNEMLYLANPYKPRDEIECALVIQMASTHSVAMAVLSRLGGALGGDRRSAS